MKKIPGISAVAAILLMLNIGLSDAIAQEGLYFGGSMGPSFINKKIADINANDFELEGNDFAWKVYGGYRFPGFIAFEGGYRDLGQVSTELSEHNSSGWDISIKPDLMLGPLQLFVKAGVYFNNVEVTFKDLTRPDINEQNTKLMFGFGAGLNIGRLGIRSEWEGLDISKDSRVSMLTAGVTYRLAGGE